MTVVRTFRIEAVPRTDDDGTGAIPVEQSPGEDADEVGSGFLVIGS